MLADDAEEKWLWDPHTGAKHAVLVRYIKAWMPILGRGAKRAGIAARLALVDGFDGRGKYLSEERGSPLLLHEVASEVLRAGVADEVDLFLVDANDNNCRLLEKHVAELPDVPGLRVHGPACSTFTLAARGVIEKHLRMSLRPSFWFYIE
jgi:three-Cys-motif partner protein